MLRRVLEHHLKKGSRYGKEIYGDSATRDIDGIGLE